VGNNDIILVKNITFIMPNSSKKHYKYRLMEFYQKIPNGQTSNFQQEIETRTQTSWLHISQVWFKIEVTDKATVKRPFLEVFADLYRKYLGMDIIMQWHDLVDNKAIKNVA